MLKCKECGHYIIHRQGRGWVHTKGNTFKEYRCTVKGLTYSKSLNKYICGCQKAEPEGERE